MMNNIGLILFDIDGVIRDVTNSYRLAIQETVNFFSGWRPSIEDTVSYTHLTLPTKRIV